MLWRSCWIASSILIKHCFCNIWQFFMWSLPSLWLHTGATDEVHWRHKPIYIVVSSVEYFWHCHWLCMLVSDWSKWLPLDQIWHLLHWPTTPLLMNFWSSERDKPVPSGNSIFKLLDGKVHLSDSLKGWSKSIVLERQADASGESATGAILLTWLKKNPRAKSAMKPTAHATTQSAEYARSRNFLSSSWYSFAKRAVLKVVQKDRACALSVSVDGCVKVFWHSCFLSGQMQKIENVPSCHSIGQHKRRLCSDITNTQVGISGETVPEGGNLRIYWPHSNHAIW